MIFQECCNFAVFGVQNFVGNPSLFSLQVGKEDTNLFLACSVPALLSYFYTRFPKNGGRSQSLAILLVSLAQILTIRVLRDETQYQLSNVAINNNHSTSSVTVIQTA